jgi:hypothetical protein
MHFVTFVNTKLSEFLNTIGLKSSDGTLWGCTSHGSIFLCAVPVFLNNSFIIKEYVLNWAPAAHTCNPSYSGGRDQEDHSLRSAQANGSRDPVSKKPITKKRAGGVAQGVGPEFKPHYHQKTPTFLMVRMFLCWLSFEK